LNLYQWQGKECSMQKSIYWGILTIGLALLLAACGAAGDPPPAPVEEQAPAAEVSQPQAEQPATTDEVAPTEEAPPMIETVEPVDEMMATEEAVVEKADVEDEIAPAEEEMLAEKEATIEPTDEAAVQTEQPDPTEEAGEIAEAPSDLTEKQQELLASLTVKGTPPELFNEVWLNSEPLKLEELQGKVVIVEFWTFG
jgi:hypothetical protein